MAREIGTGAAACACVALALTLFHRTGAQAAEGYEDARAGQVADGGADERDGGDNGAAPDPDKAEVRVWKDGKTRRVEASIWVPHDSSAVWPVVLDYDGLAEFMPNVVSSSVIRKERDSVVVRQVGRGRFIFRKTVRFDLEFRRVDPSVVRFRQVSGDFDEFSGTWTVRPEAGEQGNGSRILYAAWVRAGLPLPGFVARKLLHDMAANMMPALAEEVGRRQAARASAGSDGAEDHRE